MHIKDNDEKRHGKLFYVLITLLTLGVPLGLWKVVSMYNYYTKQEIIDTFSKSTMNRDSYDRITVKAWHYVTGAETGVSTGYGGHSIAFIAAGAGSGKFQDKYYIGIFSVDQRLFYGDMSVLSRGTNCDDATEISKQELEDLIVLGRNALVLQRVIKRDFCQMSGSIEDDTDVGGNIRQGARLAYHDL